MRPHRSAAIWLLLGILAVGCSSDPGRFAPASIAPAQEQKSYVLLISIDAFRYDYADRFNATNIQQFCSQGASAKSLIPVFPSSTFPNHYSIITGLYPEHHGIVANTFYDPARREMFRYSEREKSTDGSWYGGIPLWVLAEKQGMRAATFFWPGSDAEIAGTRPTFYISYDASVPHDRRINQVLEWFRLPESQRPHFVTLYFSAVDTAGHEYGTQSTELRRTVQDLDVLLGRLLGALRALPFEVNVFLVSDHGVQDLDPDPVVDLNSLADLSGFQAVFNGTQVMLYGGSPARIEGVLSQLRGRDPRVAAYRRSELPAHLHYSNNPRIGDVVVMATRPVVLRLSPPTGSAPSPADRAAHGYDPSEFPQMHGIFCADGPSIAGGARLEPFENIHIYPLIAEMLGLRISDPIDGSLSVLRSIYRPAPGP
jgi:alkaline phosphatase D